MECPHCNQKVSMWSKELSGKSKACPHCRKEVHLAISWGRLIGIVVVAATVLHLANHLVFDQAIPNMVITGAVCGGAIFGSWRLK